MTSTIIPVLRVNNRRVNQTFLEEQIGLKTRLEDGPFAEFSGQADTKIQVVLMESPSMRTRAVVGPKKLSKLILKVENPAEIENLLARGSQYTALYKGKNGYAFEAVSPEKDVFLVHAEDVLSDLTAVEVPENFVSLPDVAGLSQVHLEQIVLHTPELAASQAFYGKILPGQDLIHFEEAQGDDLLAAADTTWDIDSLRIAVDKDFDFATLEADLDRPFFKDKKETFVQTTDPSNMELWFEK